MIVMNAFAREVAPIVHRTYVERMLRAHYVSNSRSTCGKFRLMLCVDSKRERMKVSKLQRSHSFGLYIFFTSHSVDI